MFLVAGVDGDKSGDSRIVGAVTKVVKAVAHEGGCACHLVGLATVVLKDVVVVAFAGCSDGDEALIRWR